MDLGVRNGNKTRILCVKQNQDFKDDIIMKKRSKCRKVNKTFEDMANRESLLARGGISQQDLLIQITGTFVHVAMEEGKNG